MVTIGALSKKVGLPTKTIRFYEDIGLISSPKRLENGYRDYPESAIEELSLIKNVRDLGLPIPEIKKLMKGCENGDCEHAKGYMEKEITNYVTVLDEKIKQLQILRLQLKNLHNDVTQTKNWKGTTYCCNILKQLTVTKGGDI